MRNPFSKKHTLVRTGVSIIVLLAVCLIATVAGATRIGVGGPHDPQDPAIPPSPPIVTVNPFNLEFGKQVVGGTSAPKRITVKNTGGKSLYFDSVDVGGDNPTAFTIANDTCTGATVEPNRACILDITFNPSTTGERNASLKLNDNAPDSPQRLRLRGIGINANDVAPF